MPGGFVSKSGGKSGLNVDYPETINGNHSMWFRKRWGLYADTSISHLPCRGDVSEFAYWQMCSRRILWLQYLEPLNKRSSIRKRTKRAAGGGIAVPGTYVNGLVRANRKQNASRGDVNRTLQRCMYDGTWLSVCASIKIGGTAVIFIPVLLT